MGRVLLALALGLSLTAVADECQWPQCIDTCTPCASKTAGDGHCLMSMISGGRIFGNCEPAWGETECFLGKCLCRHGFCSDGEACVPQACPIGGQPPEFDPSPWVWWFADVTRVDPFPRYEDVRADPLGFVLNFSAVPAVLLVLGMAVAITTCACMCLGCTGHHYSKNYDEVLEEDNEMHLWTLLGLVPKESGEEQASLPLTEAEFNARKEKERPRIWPMAVSAVGVLGFSIFTSINHVVHYNQVEFLVTDAFQRAEQNTGTVRVAANMVEGTVDDLVAKIKALPNSCQSSNDVLVRGILVTLEQNALKPLDQYVDMINQYHGILVKIPDQVQAAQAWFDAKKSLGIALPLAPPLVLSVVCSLIVVEAVLTSVYGNSALAGQVDRGLKIAAVVFLFVIAAVAVLACIETFLLIVLSNFCIDVDPNVLSYVNSSTQHLTGLIYNVTEYYIRGDVRNPISGYEDLAEKYIGEVNDLFDAAQVGMENLGTRCDALADVHLPEIAANADSILDHAQDLLRKGNIYPYYKSIIRSGICNEAIKVLSWMWLSHIVVGLILFPLCALLAHMFLVDWAAWHKVQEGDSGDNGEDSVDEEERLTYRLLEKEDTEDLNGAAANPLSEYKEIWRDTLLGCQEICQEIILSPDEKTAAASNLKADDAVDLAETTRQGENAQAQTELVPVDPRAANLSRGGESTQQRAELHIPEASASNRLHASEGPKRFAWQHE
eukprot:TRINITY_DN39458_c0_g1_i1.p1 TRINITY_DN39458_c0_g1~~TRINITY_DN39458_c0_g1_i1.p1  ORF type:complete len:722 (-),score=143.94 TRINITY_DN39458_c0_g1_i1:46-2211(-)